MMDLQVRLNLLKMDFQALERFPVTLTLQRLVYEKSKKALVTMCNAPLPSQYTKIAQRVEEALNQQNTNHQVAKIDFEIFEFLSSLPLANV